MTPILFILLTGSFLAGLILHILVWRIRRPVDDATALLHFVTTLPAVLSGCAIWASGWFSSPLNATGLALMFHAGTGFTYMSLYTAAQAASPTSLVLLALARQEKGMTELEIRELFTTDLLSGNSVRSSIDEGFLHLDGDQLSLAPRGSSLIRVCSGLRSVLALPPGRG